MLEQEMKDVEKRKNSELSTKASIMANQ